MSDCNETLKELETFLDGELSDDAVAHIRGHLVDCPDCYEAFDFHAELKLVIATKCKRRAARRPAVAHRAVPASRHRRRRPHRLIPSECWAPSECPRCGLPRTRHSDGRHTLGWVDKVGGVLAVIWHQWIGVVLVIVSVLAVLGLAVGYLKNVTAQRYPNRRQQQDG